LAGDPSHRTPNRHKKAVKLAQMEARLPKTDRLVLTNLVEKDIKAADAYITLIEEDDDEEFRQMWVQQKIDEVLELRAIARASA
jgi:hypothetical protein